MGGERGHADTRRGVKLQERHVFARQRSEVALLVWSDFTGWHYHAQSRQPPRRGWSPGRWTQEEAVALAFECGFGAVRLPDGKMIKRAKE